MKSEESRNIVFFVSSMQSGGAERVAALLSNYWAAKGHNVTLVATFSGRGQCDYPLDSKVNLVYLRDLIHSDKNGIGQKINRIFQIRRLVRDSDTDVVLSFLTRLNIVVLLATLGLKTPVNVSERVFPAFSGRNWKWRFLRRLLYARAKTIIVQTNVGESWLEKNCWKPNIKVIPNPLVYPIPVVEPAVLPDTLLKPDSRIVLGVGRLDDQKGFDILINCFSRIAPNYPQWQLAIVGEGPQRAKLENLCDELGIVDRVFMPGRMGNISDWYDRADIYVLSSRFEGFPNGLLEAMAHGLAVISFNCISGPAEIIDHDVNGVLVQKNGDEVTLEMELIKLMKDTEKIAQLSHEARNIQSRFSMEEIGKRWDDALDLRAS